MKNLLSSKVGIALISILFLTGILLMSAFSAPIEAMSHEITSAIVGDSEGMIRNLVQGSTEGLFHLAPTTAGLLILVDTEGNKFETKSPEAVEKLTDEEKGVYVANLVKWYGKNIEVLNAKKDTEGITAEQKDAIVKELAELKESSYKSLERTVEIQGEALQLMKNAAPKLSASEKGQIYDFIEKNIDKIKEIKASGSGEIKLEVKVVADMTTGSASNPNGIPELVGTQIAPAGNVNLRASVVDSLVTNFQTNLAAFPYTETLPKDGDVDFTAEGALKSQLDFTIETEYAQPKKAAGYIVLTEESVTDIAGLQSIATTYLRAKHDLKKQDGILFGTGAGAEPFGATIIARAFVPGAMAATVTTPNIMDVINACVTDIFTTHNYNDEIPYMASLAMINPVDFFTEFVAAKDANGLPLYPQAGLFNRVVIGGVTIMPFYKIPAGKIFVSDMGKYNTTDYVSYTVRIGWINDQFIKNQFTMVGESRFHAFVKELDKQAFIYDDISAVRAGILKP